MRACYALLQKQIAMLMHDTLWQIRFQNADITLRDLQHNLLNFYLIIHKKAILGYYRLLTVCHMGLNLKDEYSLPVCH